MGCCESVVTEQQKQIMTKEIKICIQSNNISRLSSICKLFAKGNLRSYSINTFRFKCLKGKYLNMPTYCLFLNKLEILKFLHRTFKVDFELIEIILSEYDTNAMAEICKNNFIELLDFYMPHYLNIDLERPRVHSNFTLDLEDRDNSKFKVEYSPVQLACENGHMQVLHYIYKYFSTSSAPPALDIDHIGVTTGENCALIACRLGNYSMIRFLHSVCKANFLIMNNKNESAIQILASSAKQKYNPELFSALVYLVEKVGVSVLHGYEETLLILESFECIRYVENQLALNKVFTSKMEIEYNNRLIKRNSEESQHRDVVVDKNSLASSIEPTTLLFGSIASVVNLFNK